LDSSIVLQIWEHHPPRETPHVLVETLTPFPCLRSLLFVSFVVSVVFRLRQGDFGIKLQLVTAAIPSSSLIFVSALFAFAMFSSCLAYRLFASEIMRSFHETGFGLDRVADPMESQTTINDRSVMTSTESTPFVAIGSAVTVLLLSRILGGD
jgi:hypothetical protein